MEGKTKVEKKKVAAVAAVVRYLEDERKGGQQMPKPWALAGRLAAVQTAWLMQMRAFGGGRRPF